MRQSRMLGGTDKFLPTIVPASVRMLFPVLLLVAITLSGQTSSFLIFYGTIGTLATPGFTLNNPSGLAHYFTGAAQADPKGFLLIADTGDHRILSVNLDTGVVTRIAGTGQPGFSGDGGPAVSAQLNSPVGLLVQGPDLYVADRDNHRIRHISLATGVISTIAGNGTPGFSGDGGQAHLAALNRPTRVSIRGGISLTEWNIAIADSANHRIRSVDMYSRVITTVAGTGVAGYSGDGGPAASAQLNSPEGVLCHGSEIRIADTGNGRIRRIDSAGKITSDTIPDPPLARPVSVQELYTADPGNHRIRLLGEGQIIGTGVPGRSPDGTPVAAAQLNSPQDMVSAFSRIMADWRLWIADAGNNVIRYWARCGAAGPLAPTDVAMIFSTCPADFTLNLAAGEEIVLYGTPPYFGPISGPYIYDRMDASVKRPDGVTVAANTFTAAPGDSGVSRYPAVGTIRAAVSGPYILSVSHNATFYHAGAWIRYEKTGSTCRLLSAVSGVPQSVPASAGGSFSLPTCRLDARFRSRATYRGCDRARSR